MTDRGHRGRPCADLLESWGPQRRPGRCPEQEVDRSRETPVTPLPACASAAYSSGSVLDPAELGPQSSKTHVYFTRNLIHLVLIYLHLTHQMQFCKSRSIAKRLFCLSPPSERSRGGLGLSPQGPGGSSQGWRLSWVLRRPGASVSSPRPLVGAGMPEPGTGPDTQ